MVLGLGLVLGLALVVFAAVPYMVQVAHSY